MRSTQSTKRFRRAASVLLFLPFLQTSCATTRSVSDPDEPIDACEALRSPGFEEIMERALQRGLVRRVASTAGGERPLFEPGRLHAQVAPMMWAYQLTQRAIDQGVPQRVGTIVVAGCTAAVVAIWHLVRRGPSDAERASVEQAAQKAAAPRAGPSPPAHEGPSPIPNVTGAGPRPPSDDCQANVNACLETVLGTPSSSGTAGESICASCFWQCRNDGLRPEWPDRLANGKDCQWWRYRPFR